LNLTTIAGAVIQPLAQTALTASRPANAGTSTVWMSNDIVFLADSTGSWRLEGLVQLRGVNQTTGNQLALGITASASEVVPEPGTLGLTLIGGVFMAASIRLIQWQI
jgi:hypothetical protein